MIRTRLKMVYKFLNALAARYPLATNLFFLVIGCLFTATVFQKPLHVVLVTKTPVWVSLLIAGASAFLLGFPIRIIRKALRWRPLGLTFLALVLLAAGVYWTTRPDTNVFSIMDAALIFPVDTSKKEEFTAKSMFLLRFHDAKNLNNEFPELFREASAALLDTMISEETTKIEMLFDSLALNPHLSLELVVRNGLTTPTSVYRATGELRFGDPEKFLSGSIRHIEGRTIVTDKYLTGSQRYTAEFSVTPEKIAFPPGSAGDIVVLDWEVPDDIGHATWFRQALLFDLRRIEFMGYFNNQYQRILREMYSLFIERKLDAPPTRILSKRDFELFAVQVHLVLHHTHGTAEFRKTFALGLIEDIAPGEVVKPWQ